MYQKLNTKGLEIIGFPCNQFKEQDPGDSKEIKSFCEINYGVTFEMYQKIDVKGENIHAIYEFLINEKRALFGKKDISWNFTKFLLDREGNVIKRFPPLTTPKKIEKFIEKLL